MKYKRNAASLENVKLVTREIISTEGLNLDAFQTHRCEEMHKTPQYIGEVGERLRTLPIGLRQRKSKMGNEGLKPRLLAI